MKRFLLMACAIFASAYAEASASKTIDIPVSIPIVDAVQHQQDLYFASHSGLLKLSDGHLFKLKDSGVDLGRLRQVELNHDHSKIYAGGYGLWQLTLPGYELKQLYPGWVSRFAVSDKYYYIDTGSELLGVSKDASQEKIQIFPASVHAITQVDGEVFALTKDGLYNLVNTVSRLVKQGQFKHLSANPLYMVMTDAENIHVFSRSTNQWFSFPLPEKVSKVELSSQEDIVWIRSDGVWKKFSLINFQVVESIEKSAAFLFDSSAGPVLFDGTTLTLNKKVSIFDIQSKPMIASAAIEPFIQQTPAGTFASGAGGIYSIATGQLVVKTDEHLMAFDTKDGKNFTLGTSNGAVLPSGEVLNHGLVIDVERHKDETYIAFKHQLFNLHSDYAAPAALEQINDQEILNLKSDNGSLYVLAENDIFTLDDKLTKIVSYPNAVWVDIHQIGSRKFALSYDHGIFEIKPDGQLIKFTSSQTLPNRFFNHNKSTYVIGREGICRINIEDLSCKQISAGITGRYIQVTSNGIYYSNPHGVWMLDERALVANPVLQYVILNQRPQLDKEISLTAGDALGLHFDLKDGTVLIDGKEHSIYNHQVIFTPEKSIQIDGWYIDVQHNISLWWLLVIPVLAIAGWSVWSLAKAKSAANAEFVRLSRFQLHADEIRKSCDLSVEISDKLNKNNDLDLADAIYLSHELQEILSPIAMNARLRDSDNLSFALNSHVASIFSIHTELDVSIGECDRINPKLNADAYHLLIHMLRYAIDRFGAKKVVIHVLRESENDCLLCVEHDGKTETMLHRLISRSTDHMIMKAIAREYGQTLKFFSNEINVMLSHNPQIKATPQQAYFLASASKFGLKIQK
jgi:hypothetical protein